MSDYILVHHGIKGQKWGVRRYQNEDGSYTTAGRERYGIGKRSTSVDSIISKASNKKMSNIKGNAADVEAYTQLATYAAMTVAALAVPFIARSSMVKTCDKDLNKEYKSRDIDSLADAPKLAKPMAASKSMKLVNPGYPDVGTTSNCMMCTTAMVMREKGYDVKANTSTHGFFEKNMNRMFEGKESDFKKIKAKTPQDLRDTLYSNGDGAYGNLTIQWLAGGGHSIFWKNEGGKTHIYDSQSGEEYATGDRDKLMRSINIRGCQYARLDQAEPTEMVLSCVSKMK